MTASCFLRSLIRDRRGNKDQLEKLRQCSNGAERFRLDGAGEKPLAPEMEDVLLEWIHSGRLKGLRVSRKLIRRKALHLSNEQQNMEDFTASSGWIKKFMRRHGLSLRRKITVAQKDPEQLVDKLVVYVLQARILSKCFGYQPCNIIAMDETAVWADMTSETTVESKGSRTVCLKRTGHEKVKVSVCLAAKADGSKMKPMTVFGRRKREVKKLNEELRSKCVIASSGNAWMNEGLTLIWADKVLGKFSFGRRLLAWDSFSCHIMDSVKDNVKENNTDMVVVPSGCTKYIQAPDVCWNAPFKELVTERYDEWMAEGSQENTAQGNLKAPPRSKIIEWILQAWKNVRIDVIKSSFKSCALNIAIDGSEDELIHCFKENQPCSAGLQRLKVMANTIDDEREDPFVSLSDSDVEQEAINELDSDDENDEIIDI